MDDPAHESQLPEVKPLVNFIKDVPGFLPRLHLIRFHGVLAPNLDGQLKSGHLGSGP
jgi:hypothetical protein